MSYIVTTYIFYLLLSIGLTVWVARTLHANGRIFLVDAFNGREALADSVNHLLVVGFYLINIGYVTLALKYGDKPADLAGAVEFLSTKVGFVLVVLGVMHFGNLYIFNRLRHRAEQDAAAHPSIPTTVTNSCPPSAPLSAMRPSPEVRDAQAIRALR